MIQDAVVTKILDGKKAQVTVARSSACAGNCASCAGCSKGNRITATALNSVCAHVGDNVRVSVSTGAFMGVTALVYLFPLAMFFAGYILAGLLSLTEGMSAAAGMCGLGLGLLLTVIIHRKRKKSMVSLEIVSIES